MGIPPAWVGLVDDAAIFPPGNAPLHDAAADHVRATRRVVGRPGGSAGGQGHRRARCCAARPPGCRSSSPAARARSADRPRLCRKLGLELAGLEIALRDLDDLPGNARRVVAAVDAARSDETSATTCPSTSSSRRPSRRPAGSPRPTRLAAAELRLKFRTGGVEAHALPDGSPTVAALDRRGAGPRDAVQVHGRAARRAAAPRPGDRLRAPRLPQRAHRDRPRLRRRRASTTSVAILDERDAEPCCPSGADRPTSSGARRWFTSFGSCSVTDPLESLVATGLAGGRVSTSPSSSWVDGAAGSGYDADHLPYGVFAVADEAPRVGVRIGDHVLDLTPVAASDMLDTHHLFDEPSLNELLAAGRPVWESTRAWITGLVTDETERDLVEPHLVPARRRHDADALPGRRLRRLLRLPRPRDQRRPAVPARRRAAAAQLALASRRLPRPGRHRRAVGHRHRPAAGSAEGARTSGSRRTGRRAGSTSRPSWASSSAPAPRWVSRCRRARSPTTSSASSASTTGRHATCRRWEYVPLGPFLGKSFATSVSVWVTPLDALSAAWTDLPGQDPAPLDYLAVDGPAGLAIDVEVELGGEVVSRPPYASMYWSPAQMLAHLTANGASVRPGDLFASGTISGPGPRPARLVPGAELGRPGAVPRSAASSGRSSRTATRSCSATRRRAPAAAGSRSARSPGRSCPRAADGAGTSVGLRAGGRRRRRRAASGRPPSSRAGGRWRRWQPPSGTARSARRVR